MRLSITELCNKIIKAKIITREKSGRKLDIQRITLDYKKNQLDIKMQGHQFPVRSAFIMTTYKAQGQIFEYVGVDLRTSGFMHEKFYNTLCRVKRKGSLEVLLPKKNPLSYS